MPTSRRGPRLIPVELPNGSVVKVYANARVADALEEVTGDMTLYHGVRFATVISAVYEQGRTDGHREVFEEIERAKRLPALKNRNPGRPAKPRKRS